MKKTLFLLSFFVVFTVTTSKAQTILDFTLVNNTGEDLYGMYVSEVSDDEWGEDIIPTDILEDQSEVEVKFTDEGEADCKWDIKLTKDPNGNSVTIENVNLCKISKIIISKEGDEYVYKTE